MDTPRPMGETGWHAFRADEAPAGLTTPESITYEFGINDIFVPEEMQAVDEATVAAIVESITDIGLQPQGFLTVEWAMADGEKRAILVTGRQRLEAFRRLGWATVPATIFEGSAGEAERWRIVENFARKKLSILERAEAIARLQHLRAEVAQVGHASHAGVRALAKETGFGRGTVQRALRIAGLSDEANTEAIRLGLADNQSALHKARCAGGAREQIEILHGMAAKRREPGPPARDDQRRKANRELWQRKTDWTARITRFCGMFWAPIW